MSYDRRPTQALLGTVSILGLSALLSGPALAQSDGDQSGQNTYQTESGELTIHPVSHASMVLETPEMVIYVDPVGGAAAYEGMPEADLVLVTHEHGDHYDPDTLSAVVGEDTQLIANTAVYDMLSEDLKAKADSVEPGESVTVGALSIDTVPAYNVTEDRLEYHPQDRGDVGYILGVDGTRVYIAGDTEDTEEFRSVENIDIAFVPMNLPYTMTVEQAADGVAAFAPDYVYPYHYRGSDLDAFEAALNEMDVDTEIVRGEWYPEGE